MARGGFPVRRILGGLVRGRVALASEVAGIMPPLELTLRGVLLGGAITIAVHRGERLCGPQGRADLRDLDPRRGRLDGDPALLPRRSILENNIVQTIASAAGTLAAIVFVLPGLIMVGWWSGFPYWTTVAVCITGGVLGVMFSVPLRRALVTGSDLPYPEGVAAAEVLKVGSNTATGDVENAKGLRVLMLGSLFSGGFALLAKMKLIAEEAGKNFAIGGTASGFSTSWSMLLIGVGHLVGISVGAAMFFGMLISWTVLVPSFASGGDLSAGVDALVGGTFRGAGALHRRGHDRRRGDLVAAQDHRPDHRGAPLGASRVARAHRGRDARPHRARPADRRRRAGGQLAMLACRSHGCCGASRPAGRCTIIRSR